MKGKPYSIESVERALRRHEQAGALSFVEAPDMTVGRGKWRIVVADPSNATPTEFTTREAYILILGLTTSEKVYGRDRASS
jgi:hypothetical protein